MARYKPRFAAKSDANQVDVVDALERIGCSVVVLDIRKQGGIPDLLVGFRSETYLAEVKNPDGRNRIDPKQEEFRSGWRGGPILVVRSPEEAVKLILGASKRGR